MATDNDPATNPQPAPHGAFPVGRPVEALLRDHALVRRLVDACMNDASMAARQQAAEQMLQALEMHARLEETVFYPAVRQVDAGTVGCFEDDHHQTDDMVAELRRMQAGNPRREALLHDLIDATLHHIREEENYFFPKLDNAGLDMTAIGLQIQAFEANLVHMLAQASDRPARR
jgi:iron-sulfur cluster repair protein YtfE (RIC family)